LGKKKTKNTKKIILGACWGRGGRKAEKKKIIVQKISEKREKIQNQAKSKQRS